MLNVLKDGQFISDEWALVDKSVGSIEKLPASGEKTILPLSLWLANTEKTAAAPDHYAVWLDGDDWLDDDDTPQDLAPYVSQLKLICINFPAFTDGRGYSIARQLRANHEFTGELRAIGDVLRDQLQFYQRCGFNSYAFSDEPKDPSPLNSLEDFSVHYQDAADNYLPPFSRR